jgi:GAF domain-containing protein/DNA-binding NarL/FixJ family response regulator
MRTTEETMVEPEQPGDLGRDVPSPDTTFEEGLAYLLLFSEALLDLVPDGVGVLDEQLRVRACNDAFARVFGFDSADEARGIEMAGDPIFRMPLPNDPDRTVQEAIADRFTHEDTSALTLHGLDARHPLEETTRRWSVRLATWDTEDPRYRRVLVWAHPWEDRAEAAAAEPAADRAAEPAAEPAADRDATFTRAALGEMLLEHLALCVVDPSLNLLRTTSRLEQLLGARASDSHDRHLFAMFPALRSEGLRALLEAAGDYGTEGSIRIEAPAGTFLQVEVQPLGTADDEFPETLLLLHEVQGMSNAPAPPSQKPAPLPAGESGILAHLDRWPPTGSDRILVVESDSWTRMLWADVLRETGLDRITPCDRAEGALDRYDLTEFGAVIVGLDHAGEEAAEFCATVARAFPSLPVLALTDGTPEHARTQLGPIAITGLLTGASKEDELRQIVPRLIRKAEPAAVEETGPLPADEPTADEHTAHEPMRPAAAPEATGTNDGADVRSAAEPRVYDLVLLGAREADVSVLRLLYRVERIRIRLVFDPDPGAFGLSLAQNLGIPAISGSAMLSLDRTPDVVVTARPGLEEHVAKLGLDSCVLVTRDEVELFLVDPDSFVLAEEAPVVRDDEGDPPAESPRLGSGPDFLGDSGSLWTRPQFGDPSDPDPDPEPEEEAEFGEGFVMPSREEPESILGGLHRPEPEPEPEPEPKPEPVREPAASDSADGLLPPAEPGAVTREIGALLGALDLLLDFDRLCARVLDMALEVSGGHSGSLMLKTDDPGYLRIAAGIGLSDQVIEKTRQRVGEGISGQIAQEGEPLLLIGTIGDERFHVGTERREIRSSVCVPVRADGDIIGVLSVNSDPEGDLFGRDEMRGVASLGRQIGGAIDRSRQLRHMRGRSFELAVRAEIEAIASSSGDILMRLRRVAERIVQMLNVDTCAIWLYDPGRRALMMRAVSGLSVASMDSVTVPVGTGLVGRVAKTLRPLVLRNQVDDAVGDEEPLRLTNVAVPIRFQTELVGVLSVESSQVMDDQRVHLVTSVAGAIGEQIGHSRVFADSDRKGTLLTALGELGVAFSTAPEASTLATLVSFSATTLLDSDVATFRLLRNGAPVDSPEPDHYERLAAHGASLSDGDPLAQLEERVVRHVAEQHLPCGRADFPGAEMDSLLQRANVAAFLGLPLVSRDEQIGVLTVFRVADPNGRVYEYGDAELEIAGRLGDSVGAAAARFVGGGGAE